MAKNKIKIILISLALVFFTLAPKLTFADGLIPCGGPSDPCTLCDLIVGIHNLVKFGLDLVTVAAIAGIFFAGVMYMISAGDEKMMTSAKSFLKASVIGFAVVFAGWLIVTTVIWVIGTRSDMGIGVSSWNNFTCNNKSSALTSASPAATPTTTASANKNDTNVGLNVNPTSLLFDNVSVGSGALPQSVTLTNASTSNIKVTSVAIADDAGSGFFVIANDDCTGKTLSTSQKSCVVKISYNPISSGTQYDELRIITPVNSFVIKLEGTTEQVCGYGNFGNCNQIAACSPGYSWMAGGNACDAAHVCCAENIPENGVCYGDHNQAYDNYSSDSFIHGVCKKNNSCPSGDKPYDGPNDNVSPQCASGLVCCVPN